MVRGITIAALALVVGVARGVTFASAGCSAPPANAWNTFCATFRSGRQVPFPANMGVTYESFKVVPGAYLDCDEQARIRIQPPCWAKSLHITADLHVPFEGWTLNLGDSTTNDGYGGDFGHEKFDAEAQIRNKRFEVYENDHCFSGPDTFWTNPLKEALEPMHLNVTRHGMQVRYAHGPPPNNYATYGSQSCNNRCLWEFDTMYLGVNRVVRNRGDRIGKGLCEVCFTWIPEEFDCHSC